VQASACEDKSKLDGGGYEDGWGLFPDSQVSECIRESNRVYN